jgi:hypothetical protein
MTDENVIVNGNENTGATGETQTAETAHGNRMTLRSLLLLQVNPSESNQTKKNPPRSLK